MRVLSRASSELAAGELMQRADGWNTKVTRRALPRALPAEDRGSVPRRLRARGARRRWRVNALGDFGERIGLAFQILDDVLDVSGPPERTGKPRGADLLDGTVTLPLIVARARDAGWRRSTPNVQIRTAASERSASGSPRRAHCEVAAVQALELVGRAKSMLPPLAERQRAALELVADGVVERYA